MILVTGANGLLGSFLCQELVAKGYKVKALIRKNADTTLIKEILKDLEIHEGDLSDVGSLMDAMIGVNYIVHTAAVVSFWSKKKHLMYQTNVEGTRNIVDIALKSGIKKLIHISSIAAIGRKSTDIKISESNIWEESSWNSNYAVTKHQAELEVYRGVEEGLNTVILNPSIILGPGSKGSSSVRLFDYVEQKNKFYTEGYINYVDVRDVVQTILFFIENESISGERYILNGGITGYQNFFNLIANSLQVKAPTIRARYWMRQLAARYYGLISIFTNREPLITKETATVSSHKIEYESAKIKQISAINFKSLEDTVLWTSKTLSDQ